jgi:hypothetical protein
MKTQPLMRVVMNIVRTEKRERSAIGKVIKWIFVAFNLLMAAWLVGGLYSVSKLQTFSAAEQIGAGIGATIGVAVLLVLWALGDLILGILVLVTRGKKVIVEESTSPLGARPSAALSEPQLDFARADQRIAQLKAEAALSASRATASSPRTTAASSAAPSFGRRHA